MWPIVLPVAAFVCFVLAAIGVASRVGLGWAGMACLTAWWLIEHIN